MIITLLAEPRSGSTNLANWFYRNRTFTTLFNPDIKPADRNSSNTGWYQGEIHPRDYKYETEHLLIKEDYYHCKNYSSFTEVSDKVILLYRENETEQIESWINAKKTNNWDKKWLRKDKIVDLEEEAFFKQLKNSFKQDYLNKEDYLKISYEELYYRNGFQKVVDYIALDCVKNEQFPVGSKYRVDAKLDKLI